MADRLACLTDAKDGFALEVRVRPGAQRTEVTGVVGSALKVSVQAPPEKGKANHELMRFFAKRLGLAASQVTLLRGETSRDKVVGIAGIARERLLELLGAMIEGKE